MSKSIKLERVSRVAQTGQYHGCPDCGRLTWHNSKRVGRLTVLTCAECKKKGTGR